MKTEFDYHQYYKLISTAKLLINEMVCYKCIILIYLK